MKIPSELIQHHLFLAYIVSYRNSPLTVRRKYLAVNPAIHSLSKLPNSPHTKHCGETLVKITDSIPGQHTVYFPKISFNIINTYTAVKTKSYQHCRLVTRIFQMPSLQTEWVGESSQTFPSLQLWEKFISLVEKAANGRRGNLDFPSRTQTASSTAMRLILLLSLFQKHEKQLGVSRILWTKS